MPQKSHLFLNQQRGIGGKGAVQGEKFSSKQKGDLRLMYGSIKRGFWASRGLNKGDEKAMEKCKFGRFRMIDGNTGDGVFVDPTRLRWFRKTAKLVECRETWRRPLGEGR